MLCLEESTFGAGTGNGSVFFDRAENGYPENTVILETRHIRRNFKFLKQQLEPNIIVDYLVQHNILNTDENSFLIGKPRATKCDFILCKLLQNPKHLRELKSIIKCNPQEEGFYCFLSLPWPNSEVRARRNPATVEKVLHSPSLGIVLDRNKDELLKEIILRISNESDSIVDDFLEEDVLSVDDHKEISAEIKKSKAANLLLENISSKLPESFLKLISILKGHKLNDLGDRLLREIDSDVLDLERTENKEQLKVEFVGGDMHCSMMASKIEIRKIKMIITSDDGNERVFEKVIEEISNSEEMIAQGTHSTFNKASLGSIVIVLQTESTFAMTKLKHFLEREGISTFLTQLFGSKEVWMLLKKDKYSIEVQIREAKDPAEYTPDIMQSIEPSRNTYKSRLERCHKFLLEELEPRCLLKEREVADIFHPVLEKINRAGLRSTKVKAFLEYLTNQSEEKIKVVVEKLKEKNKYIYNQLFPDTAKYQDIDINQVKGNILDNLPELLDIVRIRSIQTPLLSTGIITPEELEFIHKSSKSCRIETLQFLKLVLHRGDEAIKIFLSGMETSYGESTVQNLLERNDNLTTNDNDRGHANIDLKAFNEDDCLLFKGRFVLDFKTYAKNEKQDQVCIVTKNRGTEREKSTRIHDLEFPSDHLSSMGDDPVHQTFRECIYNAMEQCPLPEFYQKYKNNFPMIAIVVKGHHGSTQWDDFPSDIVMRIDREFRQQRVLARDPRSYHDQYFSIPVNGPYKFNICKSVKQSKKSQDQTLVEILEKNPLPILLQFSTRKEIIAKGRERDIEQIRNLQIEHCYEEIYLQGNFYSSGTFDKNSVSVSLCPLITMAPVYGLRGKTKEEYNQYLRYMTAYVNKTIIFTEQTCDLGIKVLKRSDPEISRIIPNEREKSFPKPILLRRGSQSTKIAEPTEGKVQTVPMSQHISRKTVEEIGEILVKLELSKFVKQFSTEMIDGAIAQGLTLQKLMEDFRFKRTEAIKLLNFIKQGYVDQYGEFVEKMDGARNLDPPTAQVKRPNIPKSSHTSGWNIRELGEILVELGLGKFVKRFSDDMIDGEIVQELSVQDLMSDFGFQKTEAVRLRNCIKRSNEEVYEDDIEDRFEPRNLNPPSGQSNNRTDNYNRNLLKEKHSSAAKTKDPVAESERVLGLTLFMSNMDQSKTSEEIMNSHTCIFDTKEQLPLPDFHRKYKSKFPMIAIVVGGHYGPSQWDDLSSDLVMRIEREFKQKRVLAKNPISYKKQYISIPVNGRYKFNVVESFMRHSKDQSMADILKQYTLPVLVQFSERQEVPKEGKVEPYGKPINLLIEHCHEEIYLQGNYFFGGCFTKESVSITLSPFITMAPVHGLMTMTEENYDQYLQRMTDYVNKNSEFSEDTCNLGIKILEADDPDIAGIVPKNPTIDIGPAPVFPTRGSQRTSKVQSTNSSQSKSFDVRFMPKTQSLHTIVASQSVKVGKKNKAKNEKPPKPKLKSKPVFIKRMLNDDLYEDVYEEISDCSKLQSPNVQPKNIHGYENENFCPVRLLSITQESGDENDYEEYIQESMSTPKSNREHADVVSYERSYDQKTAGQQIPEPEYDYIVSQPYDTEHPVGPCTSLTPVQDNVQTTKESKYVSGRTIKELGEILIKLKLEKFVDQFDKNMVDGVIVQELSAEDLRNEFKFTKIEALRLRKYIANGHIPV